MSFWFTHNSLQYLRDVCLPLYKRGTFPSSIFVPFCGIPWPFSRWNFERENWSICNAHLGLEVFQHHQICWNGGVGGVIWEVAEIDLRLTAFSTLVSSSGKELRRPKCSGIDHRPVVQRWIFASMTWEDSVNWHQPLSCSHVFAYLSHLKTNL